MCQNLSGQFLLLPTHFLHPCTIISNFLFFAAVAEETIALWTAFFAAAKLFFAAPLCTLSFKISHTPSSLWNNHTDSKCRISFGDWFWHLIVENRSIVLNFHQQRPVSALKNHPRPQRPKRPMKAKKGHQRPKLSKIIDFINNQCKIINKLECHTKKKLFFKNW